MTSGESTGSEVDSGLVDESTADENEEHVLASDKLQTSDAQSGTESGEPEIEGDEPEIDVETLNARLVEAEKEAVEATARAQAEVQNLRKRLERDKESATRYALERFATELLSVADSLEMGLGALDRENEVLVPAIEGTELTLKLLVDVFKKFNIESLNPLGEPFDPELHEALTMVPNPDMEPNMVMDVVQTGYILNDRLLRAARVVVSKEV